MNLQDSLERNRRVFDGHEQISEEQSIHQTIHPTTTPIRAVWEHRPPKEMDFLPRIEEMPEVSPLQHVAYPQAGEALRQPEADIPVHRLFDRLAFEQRLGSQNMDTGEA